MPNMRLNAEGVSGSQSTVWPLEAEARRSILPSLEQGIVSTASPVTRHPQTVLFAEDNDDLREVTEYFLRTAGYEVIACADAMIASKLFRTQKGIDVLLTDYEMPVRSGVELARELTELCPSLPVMIVSGSVFPNEMLREIRARGWAFVSKPCRLPALLENLQSVLIGPHPHATAAQRSAAEPVGFRVSLK